MDRIPDEAVLRELYPVQGGATEGFEFKWAQNGQTYRVRVHNVDPRAPVGSNAYNGWVVRVQRGRRYFDPTINDFREAKYFNPNGPDYDEVIINDIHILCYFNTKGISRSIFDRNSCFYGKFVVALIFYNFKELIYWGVRNVLKGEVLFKNAHGCAEP